MLDLNNGLEGFFELWVPELSGESAILKTPSAL